jgi:soluble lytic murein transglycosylase-like protein
VSAAAPPVGAAGGTSGALAAAERVQQLQALIAQVVHRPTGATFASALNAAQAGGAGSDATAGSAPTAGAYSPIALAAGTGSSAVPTTGAYPASAPGAGSPGSAYAPLIDSAAARNGIDPAVLYGLIQQESGFDPSARSSAGALGLTQLMPSTAASLGVSEPLDPAQSIEGGARYLAQMLHRFAGNTADALAAYNAGPGAVQQYGGVPPYPETQQYVAKVLGYAASYSQSAGAPPVGGPVAGGAATGVPASATSTIASGATA